MNHVLTWSAGTRWLDFDFLPTNFSLVEMFQSTFSITNIIKLHELVFFVGRFANFFDFSVDTKNCFEFVVGGSGVEIENDQCSLILISCRDVVFGEEVLHIQFATMKDERVHIEDRILSVSNIIITHYQEHIIRINCLRSFRGGRSTHLKRTNGSKRDQETEELFHEGQRKDRERRRQRSGGC